MIWTLLLLGGAAFFLGLILHLHDRSYEMRAMQLEQIKMEMREYVRSTGGPTK